MIEKIERTVYKDGFHNLTNEEYHSSSGYSRSQLMHLQKTPYHFWYEIISGEAVRKEPSAAFILGNLVHTLVLEPETFKERYAIYPELEKSPKQGLLKEIGREKFELQKAEKILLDERNATKIEEFSIESYGKEIITINDFHEAEKMRISVHSNPVISQLLEGTLVEQSIFFTHQPTGIQCKVRPDAYLGTMAYDLKTTKDASLRGFQSSAMGYGYFLQAAMNYRAFESVGINLDEFIFFPVENKPPYATAVYRCLKDDLDYGFELFDNLMILLAQCLETNTWPTYGIEELKVPKWAYFNQLIEVE